MTKITRRLWTHASVVTISGESGYLHYHNVRTKPTVHQVATTWTLVWTLVRTFRCESTIHFTQCIQETQPFNTKLLTYSNWRGFSLKPILRKKKDMVYAWWFLILMNFGENPSWVFVMNVRCSVIRHEENAINWSTEYQHVPPLPALIAL